jgi:hypothetical protein
MTSPFTSPGGQGPKPEDLKGHLLIITPLEVRTGINTTLGPSDAISVDVVDLDAPGGPEEHVRCLWFSKVLLGSLRSKLGEKVLARMGQGVARPGQSPPWILEDATQDNAAVTRATEWLTARTVNAFQAPQPSTAPAEPTAPAVTPEIQALIDKAVAQQTAAAS